MRKIGLFILVICAFTFTSSASADEQSAHAEALKIIKTAIAKQSNTIILSSDGEDDILNDLASLPPKITDFKGIFLYLDGLNITDFSPLTHMTGLLDLSLRDIKITNLSVISDLTALHGLTLDGTDLTDIAPLGNLKNLTSLHMARTKLTDYSVIEKLKKLRFLDLSHTQVADISFMKSLHHIEVLYLWDTNVADLMPLKGLKQLRKIELVGAKVTNVEALKDLPRLEELYLDADESIVDLSVLKQKGLMIKL